MKRLLTICLLAVAVAALASGCALPKITIMDDPLSAQEHLDLGRSYEQQGDSVLAEKEYRLASRNAPLGYLYLGNLYFAMNELDKAEKAYQTAVRKMPENYEAFNNLAWLYYTRRTNLGQAEELAHKAVDLAPADKKDECRDTLDKIQALLKSGRAAD